ncbi:signal peptide peptidase SppA [Methylocapsa sp. S129]|uniref:signal peptide peptidase SppA n=1 Tax=Methylocapsa sp. S129 TaxID=1641869 RepID=UPI00131E6707|nr:signal peptide peptidase SppA [Methylocapsa sp. S129]
MSLPASAADYIVDRRRLRRQVTLWRVVAFVVVALAILGAFYRFSGLAAPNQPHIARLAIQGLITGDDATLKTIREIADSKAAAVVLTIESPGGTTTGAELLFDELRRLAAKKPVVAVVGTMAASGAYIAALGADRIFVKGNSLVGSIGVLIEFPNFSGLMDKIGVKLEAVKSSPLKATPNGMEPTSDATRAAMAALVADSFDWFKSLVKDRRHLNDDELAQVDDGRVFTGRQGVPLKLVDAIGGEREAIAWLETEKGVAKDLPVRDWRPEKSFGLGLLGSAASIAEGFGLTGPAALLQRAELARESQLLDGLVSIWQLPAGN